jgi:ribosomal protein S7
MNTFMVSGAKKTAELLQERSYAYIKMQYHMVPLEFLLEVLERVKPLFNTGYIIVRGKKKEFPIFLVKHKQLRLAMRWLRSLVLSRKEPLFSQRLFNELSEIREVRRHLLVKRRDELFRLAVAHRFNTRYIY